MKKKISLLVVLTLICTCLFACDIPFIKKDVDIKGDWSATKLGTQKIDASAEFMGLEVSKMGQLTFTSDMQVSGYILGNYYTGTYSKTKKSVKLDLGSKKYQGTLDGEDLTIVIDKQELLFAKKTNDK